MWLSGLKWMFLIIGTMIGAGYASGRELWEFFGNESTFAILLFAVLFFYLYLCDYENQFSEKIRALFTCTKGINGT